MKTRIIGILLLMMMCGGIFISQFELQKSQTYDYTHNVFIQEGGKGIFHTIKHKWFDRTWDIDIEYTDHYGNEKIPKIRILKNPTIKEINKQQRKVNSKMILLAIKY